MPDSRAYWRRQLYAWHWISAALSLAGMLLFAVTGITLNHAARLPASVTVEERQAALPPALYEQLRQWDDDTTDPLPAAFARWVRLAFSLQVQGLPTETTPDEVYIDLPRPGGSGALTIDRHQGVAIYEVTRRGWVAYLNDLHKGRHTGPVWFWFIDLLAACCIIFTLTGLALLALQARQRPGTWPLAGFSLLLPLLVALLFMHG